MTPLEYISENKKRTNELIKLQKTIKSFEDWQKQTNADDNYLYMIAILKRILQSTEGRKLELDEEMQRYYRLISLYFSGNKDFETFGLETTKGKMPYKLKKSLLILGTTGRSKSLSFEVARKFNELTMNGKQNFRTFLAEKTPADFRTNGDNAIKNYTKLMNIYLDEVGIEDVSVKNYGNLYNPIYTIIRERHILFMSKGLKTHCSSNFLLKEFVGYYGQAIYSRIIQMSNVIATQGNDYRIELIPIT